MNETAWVLVLIPLAADVFAAGLVFGLGGMPRNRWLQTALIFTAIGTALFWAGGFLGDSVSGRAALALKIVAGIVLLAIGAKSVKAGLGTDPEDTGERVATTPRQVAGTAVVVAVDKLAVAVTLAVLGAPTTRLLPPLAVFTFVATLLGLRLGTRLGDRVEDAAEIIGGVIFAGLGLIVLWSALGR